MPEREHYSHLFKGNPFEGTHPEEAFSLLNWGNKAKRAFVVDAPEPLVMLGMAKLMFLTDRQIDFRRGEAFLAVGHKSNELYVIPRINNAPTRTIPKFSKSHVKLIGEVKQTDYLSTKGKGAKENYYYHKHEKPFPRFYLDESTGVGYYRAAKINGKPSYAVGEEGIVG